MIDLDRRHRRGQKAIEAEHPSALVGIKAYGARVISPLFSYTSRQGHGLMRYFFHSDTDSRSTDTEGVDFATPEQARGEAIKMCAQMMHEAPKSFWGSRPWSITITDESGLILWNIDVDATSSAAGEGLG